MICHFLAASTLLFATAFAQAADVRLSVTEVTDARSTGQSHNGMEIRLKLTGDDVASVKGIRTVLTKAVDETGRNLLKDEKQDKDFAPVRDSGTGPETTLRLKNPARRAATVKEITGEVHLFMPDQDPAATVLVKNFRATTDKALPNPRLRQAGLQVTVLSKAGYDALAKKKEQEAREKVEKDLGKAMIKAFEGMFGSFFRVGDNDLILKLADPGKVFINAEVIDGAGNVVPTMSTTYADDMRILGFELLLPTDAQLRIFLKTPKSVVTVPVKLVDVALP